AYFGIVGFMPRINRANLGAPDIERPGQPGIQVECTMRPYGRLIIRDRHAAQYGKSDRFVLVVNYPPDRYELKGWIVHAEAPHRGWRKTEDAWWIDQCRLRAMPILHPLTQCVRRRS